MNRCLGLIAGALILLNCSVVLAGEAEAIREDDEPATAYDLLNNRNDDGPATAYDNVDDAAYQEFLRRRNAAGNTTYEAGSGAADSCRKYDFWISALQTFPAGSSGREYNCNQLNDDLVSQGYPRCTCD